MRPKVIMLSTMLKTLSLADLERVKEELNSLIDTAKALQCSPQCDPAEDESLKC